MKTTVELPDDLLRALKIRAAREDRTLRDLMTELLRAGLAQDAPRAGAGQRRVELPLVHGRHPADPDEELTPDRVAGVLLEEDASGATAP